MKTPRYPSLYQVNTRVWLTELSRKPGRSATLDDIPDAEDEFGDACYDRDGNDLRANGLFLDWLPGRPRYSR